jgi:chaperonin GroEL
MSPKQMLFKTAAREKILRGASLLADAVRVTLGPRSKCVLIERKFGAPLICNDGVTIAKEVELKDPVENLGAQVLREAAVRTGDVVGDGTSTATILAHAVYAEGLMNVTAGASAIDLKRGLDRGLKIAVQAVRELSRPVETHAEKVHVAAIAAHNDLSIGEVVAEAVEKVGNEGVVTIEEAKGTETSIEVVEGMQFDRGFLSPYFVTDPEKMAVVLEDPYILLYDKRLSHTKDLVPLLEQIVKCSGSFVIIAEDVDPDALATLVVNKLRGILACAAVKSPGYGDRRKSLMEDLALLTGGRFLAEELGVKLDSVQLEDLGRAKRVVIDKDTTTIIGGSGARKAIESRCHDLRRQIEQSTSDYDQEKLRERLAKLSGGVAVIRVGAPSEAELKNRKEAFDDAISSTKAAVAEGIVPGGGRSLIHAVAAIAKEELLCEGDEKTGLRILCRALEAPTRQIAENSGFDAGVVVDRMRNLPTTSGFDAAKGVYTNLLEAGIIDPTKVVRVALENAVSVAGVLLLTEATMTDLPEHKEMASPPQVDFEG